ncbi:MAG TPA: hemolysin family protein [Herpetosiphonaceae bacterium]
MGAIGSELLIIVLLTLANGFFSGSEIAIVSARRSRLEQQAAAGRRAARQAMALADNPDRFLATVQVGISLIGTFAAAFGGARIGEILATTFKTIPAVAAYAEPLGLGIVVVGLTYLSLIIGELVPKRIALQYAEGWALFAAPIMTWIARLARPIVAVLTASVRVVLRLLGQRKAAEQTVTEEDITFMIREATTSGTVEVGEAQLIKRVFQFTDRPVVHVMTPRTEMTVLPSETPWRQVMETFVTTEYSRIPLYHGDADHIVGVVHAKDCMRMLLDTDPPATAAALMRAPTFILTSQPIDDVLTLFRRQGSHLGIVIDEYGQVAGMVTLEDLLEELVGEIRDEYDQAEESPMIERADGSWLVDGMQSHEVVQDRTGLVFTPTHEDRSFTTIAGLIMAELNELPKVGDQVVLGTTVFEVVDMDGRRIDKVLIRPQAPPAAPSTTEDPNGPPTA